MRRGALIRTVGHGTLPAEEFATLLRDASVDLVVDVRRYPGSRRVPQFERDAMGTWLPEHDIEYRWLVALGGRRRPNKHSPNVGLRNEQFRAYADHMATREFHDAVAELDALAADTPTAIMCSESVWWRCHRRLIADHLVLVEGVAVEHLFHDGRVVPHPVTPGARAVEGVVRYDATSDTS